MSCAECIGNQMQNLRPLLWILILKIPYFASVICDAAYEGGLHLPKSSKVIRINEKLETQPDD